MAFENSVFINCPFDSKYIQNLLKPLLFTLICLGFEPRTALENTDCGRPRLLKIIELVRSSKYSIHDISLLTASEPGEYSRMNMPFELGIDFGCKECTNEPLYKDKKFLILENNQYDYHKAISDLSGYDIRAHKNNTMKLVGIIRDWFVENEFTTLKTSHNVLFSQYSMFLSDLLNVKLAAGFRKKEVNNMPVAEFVSEAKQWVVSKHK